MNAYFKYLQAVPVFLLSSQLLATSSQIDEEMIVTATRTPVSAYESLSAVSVISAEEIEQQQARDLPALLRTLPGIEFEDNGGRGALASLRIRGSEADHVLVLIDGVRATSATSGGANIQHIPLEHIERIEIVRGPKSSLYGADALAGVIQIFTKKGVGSEKAFSPVVKAEYGSHDRRKFSAGTMGSVSGTYYRASLGHEETNGINRTVGVSGEDADRDAYRETHGSVAIGHQFSSDSRIEVGYVRNEAVTKFDSGNVNDEEDSVNENAYLQIDLPIADNLLLNINGGYLRDDRETFSAFGGVFETTRSSANVQLDYRVADDSSLIFGLDHYVDDVNSTANFTEDKRENNAFYALYTGDYGRFNFQSGFRHDDNQAFGEEITSNVAAGVDITDALLLSLSFGTGIKSPTFNDLYFPFIDFGCMPPDPPCTFEGNPDLNPEESRTWELMLKSNHDRLRGYVAVYRTEVDNLIASTGSTVENIDEAEIMGAELSAGFTLDSFDVQLTLDYLDAEDANTKERLPRRARTKATLDIFKSWGDLDVNLSWLAQGNRLDSAGVLAGYNLVDINTNYQLSEVFKVGASVKNLFDTEYTLVSDFRQFRTEGRTASVFVKYAY